MDNQIKSEKTQPFPMGEVVQAACDFESRVRHVPMDPTDLRVQETVAEFILLMEPGAYAPQQQA